MNNEQYQRDLEKLNKNKFLSSDNKYLYQGDIVAKTLYKRIKKYIKARVLDVGAGTGALLRLLKEKGYSDSEGVDLYPKVSFVTSGNITDLGFKDSSFNTVICTEVLEHLEIAQIETGLKEIYRVLNKGGNLIITVPHNEVLEKDSVTCPLCRHKFHIVGHLQSFNLERISALLAANKFVIKSAKVLPITIMAKLPFSDLYWRLLMRFDKRLNFYKTLIIIAEKNI